MAIAFDSNSTGSAAATGSSITISHTCSGSDRVLIVAGEDNGSNTWTCTYIKGGSATSLTQINSDAASGLKLYYMIAPDTGTNNLVCNYPSGGYIVACAASYTGVKQTGFPDASVKEGYPADNGATEAIAVTPTVADCWVVGAAFVNANAATTAGAGTTIRQSNNNASGGVGLGDNNAAINPAASTTLNFVSSTAGRSAIAVSMAPAGGGATNSNFFMFM